MGTKIQIVFNTTDTDRRARFWSQALHYKVQDPPAGFATWEAARRAWHVPEEEWHSTSAIVDPEGRGPRILFQLMDTPKPEKNRLHLDLNVSGGSAVPPKTRKSQVDRGVDRLLRLGAGKQEARDEPPRSGVEPLEHCGVPPDPE